MTVVEPETCDCECHYEEGVMHCFPCCSPCRICGQNIRDGYYRDHMMSHDEKGEDF